MEYRLLGGSGFMVPALSFGTATFGGGNDFFRAWGATDVAEAERMIDLCLDAGLNMFDTADAYSLGMAITTTTTTMSRASSTAPTVLSAPKSWRTSWAPSCRSTARACCATRAC